MTSPSGNPQPREEAEPVIEVDGRPSPIVPPAVTEADAALVEAIRVNVASKIDEVRQSRLEGNAPADYQIAICAFAAVLTAGWRPPVQSAEEAGADWKPCATCAPNLAAFLAPDLTVKYVPCRYVLFAGEGGGCIANAVDDGYCKPHADALRELEREAGQ
jgi:hypothetical protein